MTLKAQDVADLFVDTIIMLEIDHVAVPILLDEPGACVNDDLDIILMDTWVRLSRKCTKISTNVVTDAAMVHKVPAMHSGLSDMP